MRLPLFRNPPHNGLPPSEDVMQRTETVILNRVNGFGVSEASVQRQGTNGASILVQLPGILFEVDPTDADSMRRAVGIAHVEPSVGT